MFIAMHAPGLSNQDPQQQHQPYVTLQPVDENDLANAGLVQEGMSLQQVVMANSSNINVDNKSLNSDNGQQVREYLDLSFHHSSYSNQVCHTF